MIGQNAPIDQTIRFTDQINVLSARIAELERGASVRTDPPAWTPTITQGSAVAGTVNRGWYVKRSDGTFSAHLVWVASASGTAGNAITIPLPFTLPNQYDAGGSFVYVDGGVYSVGYAFSLTTTTGAMLTQGGSSVLGVSSPTITSGDEIRFTIHGRWR